MSAFINSRPSVADIRVSMASSYYDQVKLEYATPSCQFIAAVTQEKYEKISAVGCCYSGSTTIRFAFTDLIVIYRPGGFLIVEAKAINIPASGACAEVRYITYSDTSAVIIADDLFFSPALRLQAEAVFSERKGTDKFVEYEFKDYKGAVMAQEVNVLSTANPQFILYLLHAAPGFAARPGLNNPEVKEAHDKAFQQAVDWFVKTLSV